MTRVQRWQASLQIKLLNIAERKGRTAMYHPNAYAILKPEGWHVAVYEPENKVLLFSQPDLTAHVLLLLAPAWDLDYENVFSFVSSQFMPRSYTPVLGADLSFEEKLVSRYEQLKKLIGEVRTGAVVDATDRFGKSNKPE